MNRETFDNRVEQIKQYVNWSDVARATGFHLNTVKYYVNQKRGDSIEKMESILTHAESQLRATRANLDLVINKI